MKPLESVRREFEKDDRFFNEYKGFMEELVERGYAKKCDGKGPDGKTWCIPHQGVLNPNKGKMRVAFYCGSQYRETSINKSLLYGPDLIHQTARVLKRIKIEPVAFMADIQAMFYQVKVREKQRLFLRMLWWEGNLDSEIEDHEMCVHLFGAVSSPSSSNYALRKSSNC